MNELTSGYVREIRGGQQSPKMPVTFKDVCREHYPIMLQALVNTNMLNDSTGEPATVVLVHDLAVALLSDLKVCGPFLLSEAEGNTAGHPTYDDCLRAVLKLFDLKGNNKLRADDLSCVLGESTVDVEVQRVIKEIVQRARKAAAVERLVSVPDQLLEVLLADIAPEWREDRAHTQTNRQGSP